MCSSDSTYCVPMPMASLYHPNLVKLVVVLLASAATIAFMLGPGRYALGAPEGQQQVRLGVVAPRGGSVLAQLLPEAAQQPCRSYLQFKG